MIASSDDLSPNSEYLSSLQMQAEQEGKECVVGGLIIRPEGKLFVQKRAPDRTLFPGCWDISGGHVEPRETLYEALSREIMEETGWKLARIVALVDIVDWEAKVGEILTRKREFDFLVQVIGDLENPQIERPKFSEFRWIDSQELEILQENRPQGETMILDLAKKVLELYRADNGLHLSST
jgi:8-oxo-dGTP pyrophosphatase MutT (NUDIX family)